MTADILQGIRMKPVNRKEPCRDTSCSRDLTFMRMP